MKHDEITEVIGMGDAEKTAKLIESIVELRQLKKENNRLRETNRFLEMNSISKGYEDASNYTYAP